MEVDELTKAKNLLAQYGMVTDHAQKILTRTGATSQDEENVVNLIDVLRPKRIAITGK